MKLIGKDLGKKFGKHWIFRHLDFEIETGSKTAIVGNNGSGKSTLLQIISGYLSPSEGKVSTDPTSLDELRIAYVGPYTEVIEEFRLEELLKFHAKFRTPNLSFEEMADRSSLPLSKDISEFSTGMKQRTQLALAFYYENDVILLDEPTSNLDEQGFQWWKKEIHLKTSEVVVIASNQREEIKECETTINLKKT